MGCIQRRYKQWSRGRSISNVAPHVHLIPRRKGDIPNPKGGVRNVIPLKGNYDDAIFSCDDWENEGGVTLPHVDDNTPREEIDFWRD